MLKSTRPSVLSALVFSVFAIVAVPAARAQLTFTVNEFTADKLVFTLNPGTLLTTGGAAFKNFIYLVDGTGTNTTWLNASDTNGGTGGDFGSRTQRSSAARTHPIGDYVELEWSGDLSTAGNLVTGITYTFEGAGMFTPANVSTWSLYWSDPVSSPFTLQSTGSAVTGGGSAPAIPEPSAFAALAGLAVLGLAATRRRQRA